MCATLTVRNLNCINKLRAAEIIQTLFKGPQANTHTGIASSIFNDSRGRTENNPPRQIVNC